MPLLLLLLLVGAPEKSYKLEYRFEKGVSYEDRTTRMFMLDIYGGKDLVQFHVESEQVIRRSVLKVDRKGRPVLERVEVKTNTHTTKKSPDTKPGMKKFASHGKTFVWRKKDRGGWGLFEEKGEVTDKHPQLVQRLKNWRDARLPRKRVRVGSTWEVSAERFLKAVGQPVPPKAEGRAVFKLEAIEGDVARISFTFTESHMEGFRVFKAKETGVWRFDVKRGRDLSLEMKGIIEIDDGQTGSGKFRMKRTITYAEGARGSKPRDS